MACSSCARKTLGLFVRSITNLPLPQVSRSTNARTSQTIRSFSHAARVRDAEQTVATTKYTPYRRPSANPTGSDRFPTRSDKFPIGSDKFRDRYAPRESDRFRTRDAPEENRREHWQVQKKALKEKFEGEAWNPRKKLSPDTMEGIRHLHQTHPEKFTTAVLSEHFKVSAEAIRRILRSKWQPSDEEYDDKLRRWDKRGEKIWSNLVELGVKPPKKWREMGVGRARDGQAPKWKSKNRNQVPVNDSASDEVFHEDIIPIVDGVTGETLSSPRQNTSQRHSSAIGDRL
jgi:hypothetical protein